MFNLLGYILLDLLCALAIVVLGGLLCLAIVVILCFISLMISGVRDVIKNGKNEREGSK